MITDRPLDGTCKHLFNSFQLKPHFEEAKCKTMKNIQDDPNEDYRNEMTEVTTKGDSREVICYDAKRKELRAHDKREPWDVVDRKDVPQNVNISGGRYVLVMKDERTKNEVWKAILVVQGYKDKLKSSLIRNSATVRLYPIGVLVVLSATLKFCIFSTDVTQTYRQCLDASMRDVYLKPSQQLDLADKKLL